MLHAAETWAIKAETLNCLQHNDRAMIRWICNVKAKDEVSSDSLLTKLGIQDLDVVLCTSRMRWFKAVVAGPAGPASAGPLFWPNLLSAVSLFCCFSRFCCAYL